MALDSKISVKINAIVNGLPQVKELVKVLKDVKTASINTSVFSSLTKSTASIHNLGNALNTTSTGAKNLNRSITLTAKELNGALVPVIKFGQATKEATTLFNKFGISLKNSGFKLFAADVGNVGSFVTKVITLIGTLGAAFVGLSAIVGTTVVGAFLKLGLEFNALVDNARVAISAIINASGQIKNALTGEVLTGVEALNAGLVLADDLIAKLQVQAGKLGIPFEGVLRSVQEGLGPALTNIGLSLDQVAQLIPSIAAAASVARLPVDQFAQEIRALLSGDIDRNARVANILGIKPADVDRLKGKADEYFKFVQGRLASFVAAGPLIAKTLTGAFTLAEDQVKRFAGTVTKGLADEIVKSVNYMRRAFVEGGAPVEDFVRKLSAGITAGAQFLAGYILQFVGGIQEAFKNTSALNEVLSYGLGLIVGIVNATIAFIKNITSSKNSASGLVNLFRNIFYVVTAVATVAAGMFDILRIGLNGTKFAIIAVSQVLKPTILVLKAVGLISEDTARTINDLLNVSNAASDLFDALSFSSARSVFDGMLEGFKVVQKAIGDTKADAIDLNKLFDFVFTPRKITAKDKKTSGKDLKEALPLSETDLRGAQQAYEKALSDSTTDIFRAALDAEQNALEDGYAAKLVTIEQYYAKRKDIEQRANQLTLNELQSNLTAARDRIEESNKQQAKQAKAIREQYAKDDRATPDIVDAALVKAAAPFEAERIRAKAEEVKIINQMALANDKLAASEKALNFQQSQAMKAFDEQFKSLEVQALEFEGRFAEASEISFKSQYGDLAGIVDLMVFLNPAFQKYADLLKQIKAIQSEDAGRKDINNQISIAQSQATSAEEQLKQQRIAGKITELEYERQLGELRRKAIAEEMRLLEIQKARTTDLAEKARLEAQIEQLKTQGASIRTQFQATIEDIHKAIESAATDAFASFITGAQSAKEAVKGFAKSVISSLASIVSNLIVKQVMGLLAGLLGGIGGGGSGIGSALSGILGGGGGGGFAEGGLFKGQGSGTSDSNVVAVSDKEYIVKAASVRKYGVGLFDSLNTGRFKFPGFADGGQVNPDTQKQPIGDRMSVVNYNVLNPKDVVGAMDSNSGQKVFINFIMKNKSEIRSLLR